MVKYGSNEHEKLENSYEDYIFWRIYKKRRLDIWRPKSWIFQIYIPTLELGTKEIFVDIDTALRIRFSKPVFAFLILGFGLGVSLDPADQRRLPQD